nr:glycoside hydrolase family 16 protein [Kineococcus vitellinus]
MELWVRNLGSDEQSIGILLADANVGSRPTISSQYTSGPVPTWRLLTRTFVATAPGEPGTGFYVNLPPNGPIDWQITGASVHRVAAAGTTRTTRPASTRIGFTAAPGTSVAACAWTREVGGHGWGNGELQTYTPNERNATVDGNGNLVITVRRERFRGEDEIERDFTSARLSTLGKVSVPSGSYVEASLRAPTGSGLWPAFWLIGANFPEVGWPACGEIDVFEGRGAEATTARNAVHTSTVRDPTEHVQSGWGIDGGTAELQEAVDARPHRYGVYFDQSVVRFYIDRVEVRSVLAEDAVAAGWAWPFSGPQALVLNVAVDGWEDSSTTALPRSMVVSPVEVWQGAVPR